MSLNGCEAVNSYPQMGTTPDLVRRALSCHLGVEKNPGVTAPGFTSDTREKHWSSQVQSFCSRTSGASNDTTGFFSQLLFAMHQYPRMGVSGFSFG